MRKEEKCILFVGGIWLKDQEQEVIRKSNGVVQNAANVLQKNIILGIDENIGEPITLINAKFIGAYPLLYKDAFIKAGRFNHSQDEEHVDYEVGFLNFPLIKHYSRALHMKQTIKKVCQKEHKTIYIIGYSMTYSVVKAICFAKRLNPNVKTCLIVPDLPEYMNLGKSRGFWFDSIKKLITKDLYTLIKEIDSFVLLTEAMYKKLNTQAPYIVMEGIAPELIDNCGTENDKGHKYIVYTGTLAEKYGINDLVRAFMNIKDDSLCLVICGAGDGEEYIYKQAEIDSRIKFLGTVSNEEARKWQQRAYLLVNPRNDSEEYTKYSFPSKTLEYMMTGRPVLMYKLKGVPDSYGEFLYYVENDLEESLKYILSLPEEVLEKRGKDGMNYVVTEKNRIVQTSRIINLMDSIL